MCIYPQGMLWHRDLTQERYPIIVPTPTNVGGIVLQRFTNNHGGVPSIYPHGRGSGGIGAVSWSQLSNEGMCGSQFENAYSTGTLIM